MTDILTPDPLESNSQFNRFYHFDVVDLESSDLQEELFALRPTLWYMPKPHWARERVQVLEAELARRRYSKIGEPVKAKTKRVSEGVTL